MDGTPSCIECDTRHDHVTDRRADAYKREESHIFIVRRKKSITDFSPRYKYRAIFFLWKIIKNSFPEKIGNEVKYSNFHIAHPNERIFLYFEKGKTLAL